MLRDGQTGLAGASIFRKISSITQDQIHLVSCDLPSVETVLDERVVKPIKPAGVKFPQLSNDVCRVQLHDVMLRRDHPFLTAEDLSHDRNVGAEGVLRVGECQLALDDVGVPALPRLIVLVDRMIEVGLPTETGQIVLPVVLPLPSDVPLGLSDLPL